MNKVLLTLLAISLPFGVNSAEKKSLFTQDKINIEADNLHVSQEKSLATFTGHVKISSGGMTLGADKIIAKFNGEDGDFTSITAENNVTILYKETTATGKKAVYDPALSVITLTGNVVLLQKQNALKGSTLSYNLETGDINLKGTQSGRIKGSFTLDK